jgi:phosphoglycolate phosphatase-like HAD superfamily hydrolase
VILVFDLDGTLIDSARDLAASIGELLESYGAQPLPLSEVIAWWGRARPFSFGAHSRARDCGRVSMMRWRGSSPSTIAG